MRKQPTASPGFSKLKSRFVSLLRQNKNLIILFLLVVVLSSQRQLVVSTTEIFGDISPLMGFFLYVTIGALLLPTAPLNIVYGNLFGVFSASLIVASSTTVIVSLHYIMRSYLPIAESDKSSIISRLRYSDTPFLIRLSLVRLNPLLPLPLTTSLLKSCNKTIVSRLLACSIIFIATLPASVVLAFSSLKPDYLASTSWAFIILALLLLLSMPSALLSKSIRSRILAFTAFIYKTTG